MCGYVSHGYIPVQETEVAAVKDLTTRSVTISYVITRTEAGGAQVHVRDLVAGFRGRTRMTVVAGAQDGPGWLGDQVTTLETPFTVAKHLVQAIRPGEDARAFFELRRILRQLRPDLVHCHSSKAGILGRLAARSLGMPSLFTAHGFAFTEGAPRGRRLLGFVMEWLGARCGDGIIAVSEYDRQLALRYRLVPRQKIWVVHNGVPDVEDRARPERNPPTIVMVGRFARQKDQALLIRALAGLQELNWRCCFVGDGPTERACRGLALSSGLADRIEFLGMRRDVPQLLAQSQLFVLASNWEGLPLSVLEAMRAGLPVIASDVGGTREAVVEGQTGFLIPRGDVSALTKRLAYLLGDAEARGRMGASGRERYEALFTVDQMLRNTWEVYRQVLTRHGVSLPPWQG